MIKVIQKIILCYLLVLPICSQAQLFDDFSDGDFTSNPSWQGDLTHFMVNNESQLQLDAPAAGSSLLTTPVTILDSMVWEFYFKMDFAPSTSNSLQMILQSDQADLSTGNGYYLYIGETGSDDAIQFYRLDAGVESLLATATPGAVANGADANLRMEKQAGGQWTLLVDYSGGQNFVQEFSVTDDMHGGGNYFFGFKCEYTASRVDKFYFDDISVAPLTPDTTPPVLVAATAISATEVDVTFDEALDELSATEPTNYNIDNGIGQPAAAFLDIQDKTLVHLSLQNPLTNQANYELVSNGIADISSNISTSQSTSFSFIEIETADEFDILINEIMADPSPAVTLPPVEFVELYNRSNKVLDLQGFTFSSGGTPQPLPAFVLMPKSYLVLTDDSNVDSLTAYGNVIGLDNFPGLVNTGDELTLSNPFGDIIHQASYTISAYGDPQKEEGGWTLEMINPQAPCKGESNWRASVSLLGGTPGQPNSVLDETPDIDGPNLIRAFADGGQPFLIDLFFDEGLDKITAENKANYSVSNNIEVFSAELLASGNVVRLLLSDQLVSNTLYEITISDMVVDCTGNSIVQNTATIALPDIVEEFEIIINEVLFNPETGGVDFVEFFNRSEKVLNIRDLIIGNIQEGIDTVVRNIDTDRLLFPGDYIVLTTSPGDIKSRYIVQDETALVENDLPAFSNEAGNVTLFRSSVNGVVIIDDFDYSEDFHHPLLDDPDGVSLERIRSESNTQNRNNWQSAAATAGFATPTYKNSQSLPLLNSAEEFFDVPEKKLSPDGDGFQDFLMINYKLDDSGYAAQAKIFDAEGRLVKTLFNNELLSTEGFFRWDGDTDRGDKANIGIYILWIQLFHPDGTVKVFKETCVVAKRL